MSPYSSQVGPRDDKTLLLCCGPFRVILDARIIKDLHVAVHRAKILLLGIEGSIRFWQQWFILIAHLLVLFVEGLATSAVRMRVATKRVTGVYLRNFTPIVSAHVRSLSVATELYIGLI